MNGVKQGILKSILDFMYLGEVRINQEEFTDFIRVAELFKIRGVTRDVVSIIYFGWHFILYYLENWYLSLNRTLSMRQRIWPIFLRTINILNMVRSTRKHVIIRPTTMPPRKRPSSYSLRIKCKPDRPSLSRTLTKFNRNAKNPNFKRKSAINNPNTPHRPIVLPSMIQRLVSLSHGQIHGFLVSVQCPQVFGPFIYT